MLIWSFPNAYILFVFLDVFAFKISLTSGIFANSDMTESFCLTDFFRLP